MRKPRLLPVVFVRHGPNGGVLVEDQIILPAGPGYMWVLKGIKEISLSEYHEDVKRRAYEEMP